MLDHLRRHIGVQIEADHQRQVLADHLAHARQDFAFAVVEVFGDHRAVQVEIDGIERPGGPDAVDHHLDDALIGILGDMRRGAGAAGNGRHHLPALRFRRLDKAGEPDIDVAHDLEHIRRRTPSPASRRRARNRHRSPSSARRYWSRAGSRQRRYGSSILSQSNYFARDVRLVIAEAQATKQSAFRMASNYFRIACSTSLRGEERNHELRHSGMVRSTRPRIARGICIGFDASHRPGMTDGGFTSAARSPPPA